MKPKRNHARRRLAPFARPVHSVAPQKTAGQTEEEDIGLDLRDPCTMADGRRSRAAADTQG